MAIAPKRSSDGYTRLWINTHQPWDGPVAWYEAHLVSDEGWDFYGALFPGSPVPLIGHNPYLGWSHTVNSPDLIDVYKLTINDQNKDQYWFEGYWKDMDIRFANIKVKILGLIPWKFKRVVKKSIYGPVLEFDHGSYAIRISSLKDLRSLNNGIVWEKLKISWNSKKQWKYMPYLCLIPVMLTEMVIYIMYIMRKFRNETQDIIGKKFCRVRVNGHFGMNIYLMMNFLKF